MNSREQANHFKNDFSSKYPQVNAYVIFKEPNFQVRVGDFRTRAEAVGFQKEIELLFPQSFVVKDAIGEGVRVFDVSGRLLYQGRVETEVWRLGVSISGIYLVQIADSPAQKVVVIE